MKRTIYFVLSSLLITSAALAQNTSITIGTSPSTNNGPEYIVDGTGYIKTQVFVWPVGSVHVVQFPFSLDNNGNGLPYQSQLNDTLRFTFGGWVASNPNFIGSNNPIVTVTADPSMTSLIATVGESIQVNINFGNGSVPNPICSGAPGNAPAIGAYSGIIYFNGGCVGSSEQVYAPAGSVVLNAIPYPGWVFTGWNMGTGGNLITSPYITYNIAAPTTITPSFTIAKVVNFLTQPLGLQVMVDGASINTPTAGQAANGSGGCTPDYTRLSGYGSGRIPGAVHRRIRFRTWLDPHPRRTVSAAG